MRKQLRQILSLLCVLSLVFSCAAVGALAESQNPPVQNDARIISVEWKDNDDYDGIRPSSITVRLGSAELTLDPSNNWTGEVTVPQDTPNEWTFTTPDGYAVSVNAGPVTVVIFRHATAAPITVSANVAWDDSDNVGKLRPESVILTLLADGAPCGEPANAKAPYWTVTWKDLRKYKPGTETEIVYTVKQLQTPAGYTSAVSGTTVTNTLQMASLKLTATVTGAPEDADLSALNLTVDGPDPSMPRTLTYGELTNGSYDFGKVLPGAYLVRNTNADSLVDGYIMDPANSRVADAVYARAGETGSLEFRYAYKLPEAYQVEEDYDPFANIGNLTFEILGPDERMPITLTYSQFTNGRYELPNLAPGVYTVVERNAETLVKYYTLTSSSVTGMTMSVEPDGTSNVLLYNEYTPAPTPEPDAEFVDIPVTKTWNDSNNADGNRPDSITARLYADGVEVDSHVLTEAEGWAYTFRDKPRYRDDNKTEIVYTVNEDAVAMYTTVVNGYNIVNTYQPELTSVSVSKVWNDNDNAQGLRPESIAMTLSDQFKVVAVVILNESNNWFATVNNLPTVVNGERARYAWTEQQVLGYVLENAVQTGSHLTFTNTIWKRPDRPNQGKPPQTPGNPTVVLEDYDTPLGVEIIINHVGDCFD